MKTIIKYVLTVSIVTYIVIFINSLYPDHLKYIDNKIKDHFFTTKNTEVFKNHVTIVDIDNKSIEEIGQWPWSRNIMSRLINNLNEMSPAVIGLGIIFSEDDRTSPSNYNSNNLVEAENYDETFGNSIENSNTPVILGYNFLDTQTEKENYIVPYVPAIFKNKVTNDLIGFFEPSSALLNIPMIQDASYSSGFLNSIRDENGRVISLPMVMNYKGHLLPSFPLELVRTIYSTRKIYVQNSKELQNFINIEDVNIPVNETASMLVNYTNAESAIKHIPAVNILNKNFSKFSLNDIASKIIIIGSNASGLSPKTPTPFDTQISTIDLQALVIENILNKDYLFKPHWSKTFHYLSTFVITLLIFVTLFYASVIVTVTTALILSVVSYFTLAHLFHDKGYILTSSYLIEAILLSLIIAIIINFLKNKKDLLNVKGKFASKVSKQVMEDLLDTSKKKGDLSSKRKNVTIFFSDIKGFTKITEKINDPSNLTKYINRYMDAMTKNIMIDNEGTVDKFMGDAIMAYWNAPYDVKNHSDKALTSALEQIVLLDDINIINKKEEMPILQIRIGITAGEVFVGEVGGELRSDYTIMGKNVNHAAVLEQAGKYYAANIIISQSVKDNVQNDYTMLLLDYMQVDGTSDAFNIYQVFAKGKATGLVEKYIISFEHAVQLYRSAHIDDAIVIFKKLLDDEDILNIKLCKLYISRCENAYEDIRLGKFTSTQKIDKSFISG